MLWSVRNSFLCRLFPGRGILHATYRHARATVDIDYVYLVAFREKQVLVVQVLRSIDRTFGARTEQVTFGEIPGHQRSDVFPARIACPCIGEEGAAEFTVHGDKRFHITDAIPGEGYGVEQVLSGELDATFIYPTGGDRVMQIAMDILNKRDFPAKRF